MANRFAANPRGSQLPFCRLTVCMPAPPAPAMSKATCYLSRYLWHKQWLHSGYRYFIPQFTCSIKSIHDMASWFMKAWHSWNLYVCQWHLSSTNLGKVQDDCWWKVSLFFVLMYELRQQRDQCEGILRKWGTKRDRGSHLHLRQLGKCLLMIGRTEAGGGWGLLAQCWRLVAMDTLTSHHWRRGVGNAVAGGLSGVQDEADTLSMERAAANWSLGTWRRPSWKHGILLVAVVGWLTCYQAEIWISCSLGVQRDITEIVQL